MKNWAKIAVLGITIFLISTFANVFLHEIGHYIVASMFGLNPTLHFNQPFQITGAYVLITEPNVGYVTYESSTPALSRIDALISLAGPMANFLLAGFALFTYKFAKLRKKRSLAFASLIVFIPSLISGIMNLLPFKNADGFILLTALANL